MDFKQLAEKTGLDEDEYIELLELFIDTSTTDLTKLENAVRTMNADEAEKAAHSLKGASASLGLKDIAEIARMIEKSAKKNSIQDGTHLISTLKEKIKRLKALVGK